MDTDTNHPQEPGELIEKTRNTFPWKLILLICAIVLFLVAARYLQLGEKLGQLKSWIQELGPWGPVAYVFIYILAVVVAIPGSAITVAGGALFGIIKGTILVSIGATVGAGVAFIISRHFARDAVASWLNKNEKFKKLDRMTEKHGAIIVAITRLVPIFPFNLLNYGFGLTSIRFSTYIFWSWLCMLPGTVFYVAGADAVSRAIASGEIPWKTILATIAAALVLFLLVKRARKKLKDVEEIDEKQSEQNGKESDL